MQKQKKDWFGWLGMKVNIKLNSKKEYTGYVIDVQNSRITPFLLLIMKNNKKILLSAAEIKEIREDKKK